MEIVPMFCDGYRKHKFLKRTSFLQYRVVQTVAFEIFWQAQDWWLVTIFATSFRLCTSHFFAIHRFAPAILLELQPWWDIQNFDEHYEFRLLDSIF